MDTIHDIIWAGIYFLFIAAFIIPMLVNCIAEAITGCKKRIRDAEEEMNAEKEKTKAAKEEAKAANERAAAAEEQVINVENLKKEVAERERFVEKAELILNKKQQDLEEFGRRERNEIRKEREKAKREINSIADKLAREKMPELDKLLRAEEKAIRDSAYYIEHSLLKVYPNLIGGIEAGRLHNYLEDWKTRYKISNLQISATLTPLDLMTEIEAKPYETTLTSCSCKDFTINHPPACKHMLCLAETLGILQVYRALHRDEFYKLEKEVREYKYNKKRSPSQRTKTTSLSEENTISD